MTKRILVLPGDGIGPEIVAEAVKVLDKLAGEGLDIEMDEGLVGGAAYDAVGTPLPEATLEMAREADGILLGAVGGYKWESLDISVRSEKGLLGLRSELKLFANLRPAILYPQLADASTLKPEVVSGLDMMIVRELTGGIYFGQPRGIRELENGEKEGFNTLVYRESEIERIGRSAFDIARKRGKRVCSVDKANVLETSRLWRDVTGFGDDRIIALGMKDNFWIMGDHGPMGPFSKLHFWVRDDKPGAEQWAAMGAGDDTAQSRVSTIKAGVGTQGQVETARARHTQDARAVVPDHWIPIQRQVIHFHGPLGLRVEDGIDSS